MEFSNLLFVIVLYSSIGAPQQTETKDGGSKVASTGFRGSEAGSAESKLSMPLANVKTAADLNDRAMQHPLCIRNATAYVGQTAKMYCCLARLDRELSVSWIRKGDVVILTHGTAVFTSDERVTAVEENGIWSLVIRKVGHNDAGVYECQTNSEIKGSVTVKLDIKETKAKLSGPSEYIHSGSTLKLSCRVYLGPRGPDADYARNAVIHWFHEQRLLDPELERWRSRSSQPRIMTNTEIGPTGIEGWLEIAKVTPFDSGNYTCVPSYAIPAWIQILVLPDASQADFDGVSEVKVDTSAAAAASQASQNLLNLLVIIMSPLLLFLMMQ